jgi:asparagine synthase (glutamine-hydrolysing)
LSAGDFLMCGIAGFITDRSFDIAHACRHMADQLVHRGPDDSGDWIDVGAGVAIGHRRLAIVDLSPQGHQPMVSVCGRYVLALNGEIYNFEALRTRLKSAPAASPAPWRGHSDTEVLLEAIRCWGLERTLSEIVGMFAFALWDRLRGTLSLVRDRFGEKPLYYGAIGSSFVFGSELKALRAFPDSRLSVDPEALARMLQFGYVPAPASIYRNVHKLLPGSMLCVRVAGNGRWQSNKPQRYWSIDAPELARRQRECAQLGQAALVENLDALLRDAVRQQMVADVPLGAFLSGGVDSSLVVAMMQATSSRQTRTFTIGFSEEGFNEAPYAMEVARHLGTDHTELYVSAKDAAAIITELPYIYDEPFADSSQIPTSLVARMTRSHVTVALSGDGGDELFGGYPRYQTGDMLWRRIERMPGWQRHAAARLARSLSPSAWDRVFRVAIPSRWRHKISGHRVHRFAEILSAATFGEMYNRLVSQWHPETGIVLAATDWPAPHVETDPGRSGMSRLAQMRKWDIDQYLPDDILVKVDRAGMSTSLETRAPMLDHRVAEFAWALPDNALIRDGRGKWLLRQVLDKYVPRRLIERPKAGFAMPVARWLRTDLRDWAEHLLDERRLREQGWLAPEPIRSMWRRHLAGTHDFQAHLWNVLMFQAWLEASEAAPRYEEPNLVRTA